MVIAPDCGSGGPGFDSRWPPFFFEKGFYFPLSRNIGGWQLWHSPALGPSPSGKAQAFDACSRWFESNWPCYETLAQSVEHLTFNQVVAGSIPACLIPFFIRDFADVAELADAPDLGSGGRPCRFKSCHPQDENKVFVRIVIEEVSFITFFVSGKTGLF